LECAAGTFNAGANLSHHGDISICYTACRLKGPKGFFFAAFIQGGFSMFKKVIAAALALILCVGISSMAYAADWRPEEDWWGEDGGFFFSSEPVGEVKKVNLGVGYTYDPEAGIDTVYTTREFNAYVFPVGTTVSIKGYASIVVAPCVDGYTVFDWYNYAQGTGNDDDIILMRSDGGNPITSYKFDEPGLYAVYDFGVTGYTFAVEITGGASSQPAAPAGPPSERAVPTAQTVMVDGVETAFDAYNIGGSNYFKLRDLAFAVSGSAKQFEVGYDAENNAISLTSGLSYTAVGGELTAGTGEEQQAFPTQAAIFIDEASAELTAYSINNSNYFKLRDIGTAFNFDVYLEDGVIYIETTAGYGDYEAA
jgi:hypothetical protein